MPIANVDNFIRSQVKGDATKTYLLQKHQWSDETFVSIDWKGLKKHLPSLPLLRRFGLLQLIHNWQNTGQQKEPFERSKCKPILDDNLRKLQDDQIQNISECPFNCAQTETHLHLWYTCLTRQSKNRRN